jgi:16S rRNA C967 or C1407 C5-methylase (RsmB/RsmF family)/transcription termination factor NusB
MGAVRKLMPRESSPRTIALKILTEIDSPSPFHRAVKLFSADWEEQPLGAIPPAAQNLLLTTARNIAAIDHIVSAQLTGSGLGAMPAEARSALRLASAEVLFTRTQHYAAVSEWVELVKPSGAKMASLANAVLRKIAIVAQEAKGLENAVRALAKLPQPHAVARCATILAEGDIELLSAVGKLPLKHLAHISSHPQWLLKNWREHYGDKLPQILSASQRPHKQALRRDARQNLTLPEAELAAELKSRTAKVGFDGREYELVPLGSATLIRSAFDTGIISLQGVASQAVVQHFPPPEGGLVLDACAGSGMKATQIALMMGWAKRLVACDISKDKLEELVANFERLKIVPPRCFSVDLTDPENAAELRGAFPGGFARIYVDAPCTGTGTLGRLPFKRFRLRSSDPARMAQRQVALIKSCVNLLSPAGDIVYITCSLQREENEGVIKESGLEMQDREWVVLPVADWLEGMFAAAIKPL